MLRFFILFLLIQGVLFAAELARPIQQGVIIPFTESIAFTSATLLQWFDPDVLAHGVVIHNPINGFGVAIRPGCNGVEAVIILTAAIFAFPQAPWLHRIAGLVVGALTVQALNLMRIISLFYLGQWNKTAFDWAHLYVWEVLIMLDVLIVLLVWIRTLPKRQAAHAAT